MEKECMNNRFLSLYNKEPERIVLNLEELHISDSVRETLDSHIHQGCSRYAEANKITRKAPDFCYNDLHDEVEGGDLYIYKGVKLHKRILKYIKNKYKEAGYDITQSQLNAFFYPSIMGDMIFNGISDGSLYYDVTCQFDWDAGDFGDEGSCFWECRSVVRPWMSTHHFFAFRVYDEDQNGIARMWVYLDVDKDKLYCFNGYGMKLEELVTILSGILGCNYTHISLDCDGEDCGVLYINNGTGYVLHDTEAEPRSHIDIREDLSVFAYCHECDNYYMADYGYEVDGKVVCPDCAENSVECDHCGSMTFGNGTMVGEESWCNRCARYHAFYCRTCREYHPNEKKKIINGYIEVCQDCYDKQTKKKEN